MTSRVRRSCRGPAPGKRGVDSRGVLFLIDDRSEVSPATAVRNAPRPDQRPGRCPPLIAAGRCPCSSRWPVQHDAYGGFWLTNYFVDAEAYPSRSRQPTRMVGRRRWRGRPIRACSRSAPDPGRRACRHYWRSCITRLGPSPTCVGRWPLRRGRRRVAPAHLSGSFQAGGKPR